MTVGAGRTIILLWRWWNTELFYCSLSFYCKICHLPSLSDRVYRAGLRNSGCPSQRTRNLQRLSPSYSLPLTTSTSFLIQQSESTRSSRQSYRIWVNWCYLQLPKALWKPHQDTQGLPQVGQHSTQSVTQEKGLQKSTRLRQEPPKLPLTSQQERTRRALKNGCQWILREIIRECAWIQNERRKRRTGRLHPSC